MLDRDEGTIAVRLARSEIKAHLLGEVVETGDLPEVFEEKRGVFVTLHKNGDLRGCIGYPEPVMPLLDAVLDSAVSAAVRDPRFPPVRYEEMEEIVVEVTVLTPPVKIDALPSDLPKHVEVGRHGLIVRKGVYQGLLLPQVATEWDFDAEEFLSQTCVKAGLPPDAWLTGAAVYSFEGQIFTELEPDGEVVSED
ncbi:MAG TPA: TIGR00296 family protein [Methanosarcinales archaeon]|nr:TIGR00296 family protein [Methanosarcinales archaeon]